MNNNKPQMLTLILLLVCQYCFSQDYTPFYLNNAKWTMEQIHPTAGAGDGYSYWEIYTADDTLINNKLYRKLATKNLCELWYNSNGVSYLSPNGGEEFVFGGLREENKKVYFQKFNKEFLWPLAQSKIRKFTAGEDHLLYDFDISVGDTIHYSDISGYTITNGDTSHYTTSYHSIVVDLLSPVQGHNRYRMANSSGYEYPDSGEPLLEGIGSSHGLFGHYDSFFTYLSCFSVNDDVVLFDYNCDPCSGFVSSTNSTEQFGLKVYPNPVTDVLFIDNNIGVPIASISLMDNTGNQLFTKRQLANNSQLDLSNYHQGVLFLYVQFDNGMELTKKIIVFR